MDKEFYIKMLETNAKNIEVFKNFDTILFHEMLQRIEEAKKCILFEMPVASITLTNHILERVLKLALIYDFAGFTNVETENYGNHYYDAHKEYKELVLFDSINKCKDKGLITDECAAYIHDNIRKQFRNGFSHSDNDTVLLGYKESVKGIVYNYNDTTNSKSVDLNIKTIPGLSSAVMYKFAENNYKEYFAFVFKLMKHIEIVLKRKHNITDW